jgi:hypothetical protein
MNIREEVWMLIGAVIFVAVIFYFFPPMAHACEQEILIIDGKTVVCSTCGGVTVCDKEPVWKN